MSNNFGFDTLSTGQSNKEATVNTALGQLDAAMSENFPIDVTTGDVTLTAVQFRQNLRFNITAGVASRTINLPGSPVFKKLAFFDNAAAFAVNLVLGTTTVVLRANRTTLIYATGVTNGLVIISGLLPKGGANGEVLKKSSATDFDFAWATDISGGGGGGLPTGGVAAMPLIKQSGTDGDAAFRMQDPMSEVLWNLPTTAGLGGTSDNIIAGGSIATNSQFGGIDFKGGHPATAINKNMNYTVARTGNFDLIVAIRCLWPRKRQFMSGGIWVADATTFGGRWESWVVSSEAGYSRYKFGNLTAGSFDKDRYDSRDDVNVDNNGAPGQVHWLRMTSVSGTKKVYVSYNGIDWIWCGTPTAWTTHDRVGVVFNVNGNGSTFDGEVCRMHLVHWSLT